MNRFLAGLIILVIGAAAGYYISDVIDRSDMKDHAAKDSGEAAAAREPIYWVAPMDPNFRRDEPGKSPMGMDLVPVYADENQDDNTVQVSPALQNSLGVRTATATIRPLWRRVEATGYVSFDETQISHVHLRTEGWVVRALVNAEGERVNQGDLLFELYSPELVNAQKEFLQASRRGDNRLITGASEKLRALGMIPAEIEALRESGSASENIKVIAPRSGVVTHLAIRDGMFVQPNMTAVSLASLDSVWLQAEVFESQAEWVAEGQAAEAWLDYLPGSVFSGEVDYVYPVLDPETRTLRVRLRFDNPGEKLKPNMYARVSIFGRLRPRALSIPREALIRGPNRDRVVVALGDGRFESHEVLAGMESGEWVEIVAGIDEGDEVVTSAQFLIDSEASLRGSVLRLGEIEPATGDDTPVTAFGSGWIEEINLPDRRMRVSHGPIAELSWPAMNMDFEVGGEVNLDAFEVGQDIRFQLRQAASGRFMIDRAFLPDVSADRTPEEDPDVQENPSEGSSTKAQEAHDHD